MPNVEGLNADFRARLSQLVAASGGRIKIGSGFRSTEEQARLYKAKPNLAAPPGRSNHEKGLAADLVYADRGAQEWAHANAGRFGLRFPMLTRAPGKKYEPWHVEPAGAKVTPNGGYRQMDDHQVAGGAADVDASLFTVEGQIANLGRILVGEGAADGVEPV